MRVLNAIRHLEISHEEITKALGIGRISLMHDLSESELITINGFLSKKIKLRQEIVAKIAEIGLQINLLRKQVHLESTKSQKKKIRTEIGILQAQVSKLNHQQRAPQINKTSFKKIKTKRRWAHVIFTPMGT